MGRGKDAKRSYSLLEKFISKIYFDLHEATNIQRELDFCALTHSTIIDSDFRILTKKRKCFIRNIML